jgi:hypothetical protein
MGPGKPSCGRTHDKPPYLDAPWWTSTYSKEPEFSERDGAVHI